MSSILIADDEADLCELLAALFNQLGFSTEICLDGEALARAVKQNEPPSAIVMDLLLPFVDGFDLIRQIRNHQATAEVPIVVLSDLASEAHILEAFRLQVNEILSKPFQPQELIARVTRWIGQPPLPPLIQEAT